MSQNLLAQETSPYLLLHKDNPVHWRPWGSQALKEAQESGKPIHLSVGYTSCHWCHVMARESYEDPNTAAFLNENFVNVKVDREERPDIDLVYQASLTAIGRQGGWPLTAFLTPKGEFFFGGTYFPKEAQAGGPNFRTVLEDISRFYKEKPETVTSDAAQITNALRELWNQNRSGTFSAGTLEHVALRAGQRFDIFFGGLSGSPKFHNSPLLELMWRGYLRAGTPQLQQIVLTALDRMCQGGIYDHLGGGFFRYSVDETWLVPHFEKMLYDNAQLVDILTLVWQHTRIPLFMTRVSEIVAWLKREMMVENAAFASSLDAESEGTEGKFYVWTEADIDAALAGTFVQRFKEIYGVQRDGNFNGTNVLNRLGAPAMLPEADEALLATQRTKLLAARAKRARPMRDDKVLADWNGMMIAALAGAGVVFRQPEWTNMAAQAFRFVVDKMSDGDRLFHSYCGGKAGQPGYSDDYANMARAALTLWEMTGEEHYFERAQAWTRVLNEQFWDAENGGYFYTPHDSEHLLVRIRTATDGQTPAANAVMIGVIGRLYWVTGQQEYRDRSNALIQAFATESQRALLAMATYFNNFEFVLMAMHIVIVGPAEDSRTHELINAVMGRSLPNRLLTIVPPSGGLPAGHPAFGKTMQNGQPTAYVCQRGACSSPVTSPVTLSQALQQSVRPAGA